MNYILDNQIKILSGYSYKNGNFQIPSGWKRIWKEEDIGNGFYAEAFIKDGVVVILYRGTDTDKGWSETLKDLKNDNNMLFMSKPSQAKNAENFYKKIASDAKYKDCRIYVGGHSLGGSLAGMVASMYKNVQAVTFNAFGTKHINDFKPLYPENVTNYGNAKDPIFMQNISNQIGKTLIINSPANSVNLPSLNKRTFDYHKLESMGDLWTAKTYDPKVHKITSIPADIYSDSKKDLAALKRPAPKFGLPDYSLALRPAKRLEARLQAEWAKASQDKIDSQKRFDNTKLLKGYVNKVSKSNRIFTEEEIKNFSIKEQRFYKAEIAHQKNVIGIPTKEQVKKAVSSGGMVFVKEYVRGDGVKVHSYYRSRPSS